MHSCLLPATPQALPRNYVEKRSHQPPAGLRHVFVRPALIHLALFRLSDRNGADQTEN